jgi:cysteine desulfurase
VRLEPLIDGGGQERGLRSGTLPAPLCVGLGEACAIAGREMVAEATRLRALRDRLYDGIAGGLADVALHGDRERRIAGNLNLGFAGIDSEALMADLPDLAISSGSACASAALEPSYVLRALGIDETAARGAVRLGVGRFTTESEVDFAVERLVAAVRRRRAGRRNPAAAE